MEIHDVLRKAGRVEAPPGFERRIMNELSARKSRKRRVNRLRLSFAGAAAVLLLAAGLFFLPQNEPVAVTGFDKEKTSLFESSPRKEEPMVIPIIEAVDYTGEFPRWSDQPPTIYILERVSESTDSDTRY